MSPSARSRGAIEWLRTSSRHAQNYRVTRQGERLAWARTLTRVFVVERVTGIEPALSAWESR